MPRCQCPGSSCSCLVRGQGGVAVAGTGSASDPYMVSLKSGYVLHATTADGILTALGADTGTLIEVAMSHNITDVDLPILPAGSEIRVALHYLAASKTIAWGTGFLWPAGTPPTPTNTINTYTLFRFIKVASGWLGQMVQTAVS